MDLSATMADDKKYQIVEVDETVPQMRKDHMAVCVKNNILVFGGNNLHGQQFSCHVIWMFNMFTEQWSKHVIPRSEPAPHHSKQACAVAISDDVYVFGGLNSSYTRYSTFTRTNAVWTLTRTSETCYVWNKIPTMDNKKAPSPRGGHRGWQYAGNLWVFGGCGPSPVGYLNDNGEYYHQWNNQLLSFDPSSRKWTNPKSSGAIPSPRANGAAIIVSHNVWFYGGFDGNNVVFDELYKLNMPSLIWTMIQTVSPKPPRCYGCTLIGTSQTKLVLHGGAGVRILTPLNGTGILDIRSQTWRQYKSNSDHARCYHTSTVGVNGCAVTIGGEKNYKDSYEDYSVSFLIMLEPRSLRQLAMQMVLKHRVELPWQNLPNKLIALLGISESDERTIEEPPSSTS